MNRAMEFIIWLRSYTVVPMLLMFLLIIVAAYAPRQKSRLQRHASIPLRDDQ